MKNKQNIITISAYILLMVLFFMIGYFFGRVNTARDIPGKSRQINIQSASLPTLAPETEFYRLKIVEDSLVLFKITPNSSEEIYSIQISEGIFPPEDINELRKGITFGNIYDAHSFIENFVS